MNPSNIYQIKSVLLISAEAFASRILKTEIPAGMCFHNIDHTRYVVNACMKIHEHCPELEEEEKELLLVAAWLHDTGLVSSYHQHEEAGKEIARAFLQSQQLRDDKIDFVLKCIGATQKGVSPTTLAERILCDADLFHLASNDYFCFLSRLRQEWKIMLKKELQDHEWHLENIQFLSDHQYFTDYGKAVLQPKKERNLADLRQRMTRSKGIPHP